MLYHDWWLAEAHEGTFFKEPEWSLPVSSVVVLRGDPSCSCWILTKTLLEREGRKIAKAREKEWYGV